MLQTIKLSDYETTVPSHLMYVRKFYCYAEYLRREGTPSLVCSVAMRALGLSIDHVLYEVNAY